MAWAMASSLCGVGRASSATTASLLVSSNAISSSPLKPVSIERNALCRDSAKERPIAMTSPTDFIEVVSKGSVPGNFSNAKRGIFVTT